MNSYLSQIFAKIDEKEELTRENLKFLLCLQEQTDIAELFRRAYAMKLRTVGNKVYFRGIIEFSNICEKDCYYCGIRRSNAKSKRFFLSQGEVVRSAVWAYENNYGSLVLQSGERCDKQFVDFVEAVLLQIQDACSDKLGITLSLGEQSEDTYARWFAAGARRYLLRMETSNKDLYQKLHPPDHSLELRKNCLQILRKVGYQVGTGVMIDLPFQTIDDLVNDIIFFKKMDVDMIGMGPYLCHSETPLATDALKTLPNAQKLQLGLKMIAVTRLHLQDINIAATTALQALASDGREQGLLAGANIIMPNVTDTKYRAAYQLYENKPCIDENSTMCRGCLQRRVQSIGESIAFSEWGDSPHFFKRIQKEQN